jgi:hypothetical protein
MAVILLVMAWALGEAILAVALAARSASGGVVMRLPPDKSG